MADILAHIIFPASVLLLQERIWLLVSIVVFLFLVLAFLFNFFKVFMDFLQAQGCFAAVVTALVALPGLYVLCIAAGYSVTSAIIALLSVIGAVTGYIVRDTEGNVGKFGYFLMVICILTLILALVSTIILQLF